MSDLRFQYGLVNGLPNALNPPTEVTFSLPNTSGKALTLGLSGVDSHEADRLIDAFRNASPIDQARLQLLGAIAADGLNDAEKRGIEETFEREMAALGVSGDIVSVTLANDVPAAFPPTLQDYRRDVASTVLAATEISPDHIRFHGSQAQVDINLTGLSAAECGQMRRYFESNPDEALQFGDLMHGISQDRRIASGERDHLNNELEQLLIRAGVSADVLPASVTISEPAPNQPAFSGYSEPPFGTILSYRP